MSKVEEPPKKKGLFARIRARARGRKSHVETETVDAEKRERTPSPTNTSPLPESPRSTPNAATPAGGLSNAGYILRSKRSNLPLKTEVTLDRAPTARESAFGGPPRYDWIDIETSAAIKVQSAFRRNRVMREMEKEGKSTAAIRNRARRRKAMSNERRGNDDVPGIFSCCGMGLAFGDATEDYEASREQQKQVYEQRKKEREEREAVLRSQYRRAQSQRPRDDVMEVYEVLE